MKISQAPLGIDISGILFQEYFYYCLIKYSPGNVFCEKSLNCSVATPFFSPAADAGHSDSTSHHQHGL